MIQAPVQSVTIPSGANISAAIDLGEGNVLTGLYVAAGDGTSLTFQVADTLGGTYADFMDGASEVSVTVSASAALHVGVYSPLWEGKRYIKIRSGTSASPTTESPARAITLFCTRRTDGGNLLLSQLNTGNTLWVDGENGDDDFGSRGQFGYPYATIGGALADAQSGDTIHVRAGVYDERDLLRNGVNIYGPDADVIYTGSAVGGIFDDSAANGANAACTATIRLRHIKHNGVQTGSPAGNNGAINIENADSDVYVECVDIHNGITNATSAQRCAVYCEAGKLIVRAKRKISCAVYDAIIIGDSAQAATCAIECDEVYTPTSVGGDGVEWVAGDFSLRCRKIDTGGTGVNGVYDTGSFKVFIDAQEMIADAFPVGGLFPNSDFYIRSALIASRSGVAIDSEGGYPHIIGAKIKSGGGNAAAATSTGGHFILQDCVLVAHGTAVESITGTANLKVYGTLTANKDKAAGITVTVGAFPTPDTDVT